MRAPRAQVYQAINSERDYQEKKWGANGTHELSAYILYMEHYLAEARRLDATTDTTNSKNRTDVLNCVRKVTALGVACMEVHGAPGRTQ